MHEIQIIIFRMILVSELGLQFCDVRIVKSCNITGIS